MIMQTKKEMIEFAKGTLKSGNWRMFVYWLACIRETFRCENPFDLKTKLIELGVLSKSCETRNGNDCCVCVCLAKEDEYLAEFELYSIKILKETGKWIRLCEVINECIIKSFGVFPVHVWI